MFSRTRIRALVAGALVTAVTLVGCTNAEQDAQPSATTTQSGADGGPERIVSLSPTGTEMLYAIGAGDQVVAVDQYSHYPEGTPMVDGLSGFQPNVESVLTHNPDLVVANTEDEAFITGLSAAGVELITLEPAVHLDDTYDQLEQLGSVTGNTDEAADVAEQIQREIDEAVASVPTEVRESGLTYFHEVSENYYSVTDETFLGQVYQLFGMSSIATGDSGYPQLTQEAIIGADPDMIFLADAESEGISSEDVAARPGWETITAVREGRIFALDEDLASRWGPRIPLLVRQVADALNESFTAVPVPAH